MLSHALQRGVVIRDNRCIRNRTAVAACLVVAVCLTVLTTAGGRTEAGLHERLTALEGGNPPEAYSRSDLRTQRKHAWSIVSRLSSPNDAPIFKSWRHADDVFARAHANKVESDSAPMHPPVRGDVSDAHGGTPIQSGEPQVIIFTMYNETAYQHIRGNELHLHAELERLRAVGQPDSTLIHDRTIPPLPADAGVLLTAWWPVARESLTALPVWDPDLNPPRKGGNSYITWQRAVAIDPSAGSRHASTASIDFAGKTFSSARRVGLHAFHHIVVDQQLADRLMRDDFARKAAVIALGRVIEVGDYLALVAMHVATKQTGDWLWATLWWHDQPARGRFAEDRPEMLHSTWRNYLLDVAFDAELPIADDRGPNISFNPWLEARFPDEGSGGGTVSNCVACHQRASYPPVSFLPITRGAPDLINDAAYAPGRLRTDFLWSLARQATPSVR